MSLKKLVESTNRMIKEAEEKRVQQAIDILLNFEQDGIKVLPIGDNVDEFYNVGDKKDAEPVIHNYMVNGRVPAEKYDEMILALKNIRAFFRDSSYKRSDGQVEVNLDLPNY